jgi:hypothetical protein
MGDAPQQNALTTSTPVDTVLSYNSVCPYEQRLANDLRWAMSEGDRFFRGEGGAHDSLRKITKRLNELNVPYAVAGGMALFSHGFRRYTDDVDILVTKEGLQRIHEALEGRGFLRPFSRSKNLRDTDNGVKIEFLVSGQFPGDGKPKEIAFPDPSDAQVEMAGIQFLNLPTLINLKLASGLTGADRSKDIGDVQELIKILALTEDLADSLHPFVRQKYRELCRAVRPRPKRYVRLWRNKWLTSHAKSIDDMIEALNAAAAELDAMRADGVILEDHGGVSDDYADLVTTDPEVAKKYAMEPEEEFWPEEDDDNPVKHHGSEERGQG